MKPSIPGLLHRVADSGVEIIEILAGIGDVAGTGAAVAEFRMLPAPTRIRTDAKVAHDPHLFPMPEADDFPKEGVGA